MIKELVSIITPSYNSSKFIKETIASVQAQTYSHWEMLITDDGSTDNSFEIIKEICKKDSRIKLFSIKNAGPAVARNNSIKHAKGKYIAFIDSDDLWKKNKLLKQIEFMHKKNIEISHTSYEIIDDDSVIKGTRQAKLMNYKKLIKSCDIGLSTVIIKKSLIENLRFPNLKTKEDYVLWLEIAKNGKIIHALNTKLTQWRKSNNSLSSSVVRKLTDGYYVYRYYLKFNVIKSLYSLLVLSINFLNKTK